MHSQVIPCVIKKLLTTKFPLAAQRVKNPTVIHKNVCSIPGLAQWVKAPALPQAAV